MALSFQFQKRKIKFKGQSIQTYSFGTGKRVVFSFPSFPHSGLYYALFLRHYDPTKVRFITFDLPGWIGYSDNVFSREPFSIETYVDIASAVLGEYEVKHLNVIGYSFGGSLAALFTERYSDRVDKLVLVSPLIDGYLVRRNKLKNALYFLNKVRMGIILKFVILREFTKYKQEFLAQGLTDEDMSFYGKMARHSDPRVLVLSINTLFNTDLSHDVSSLQDKKLLIVNSLDEDDFFRRQAEHVRRILRHKKSMYIHGHHEDFMLKPQSKVVRAVMNFLTSD